MLHIAKTVVLRLLPCIGVAGLVVAPGLSGQANDFSQTDARSVLAEMARTGGAWVTSNAEYWTADSGEPREYLLSHTLEANGFVARGCMWGRSGSENTSRFWTFYSVWDPVARAILVYQVTPAGGVGVGHERPLPDGTTESVQSFLFPGGDVQRVRHISRLRNDTLVTRSYDEVDGQWAPRRVYTWVWQSLPSGISCASQ